MDIPFNRAYTTIEPLKEKYGDTITIKEIIELYLSFFPEDSQLFVNHPRLKSRASLSSLVNFF